jgi:hypothetical protein
MNKNKRLLIFLIIIILVLGAVYIKNSTKKTQVGLTQKTFLPKTTKTFPPVTPIAYPSPSITVTLTPAAENAQNQPASNPSVSGGPRGQVICDYKIPPDPNNYGLVALESNWNNLILGKNGSAKIDLCASSGPGSSLMSIDTRQNGSRTDNASWIILNGYYTFTLYDEHGGDLPDCAGAVLSSCVIDTLVPSPASNFPGHGPH